MDDIEGDDPSGPDYARPSEAEGWRRVCAGTLATLVGLVLILAFFAAACGLAQYIGGPVE